MKPSYIYNGNFYTGKMTSLYWIGPQEKAMEVLGQHTLTPLMITSSHNDTFLIQCTPFYFISQKIFKFPQILVSLKILCEA